MCELFSKFFILSFAWSLSLANAQESRFYTTEELAKMPNVFASSLPKDSVFSFNGSTPFVINASEQCIKLGKHTNCRVCRRSVGKALQLKTATSTGELNHSGLNDFSIELIGIGDHGLTMHCSGRVAIGQWVRDLKESGIEVSVAKIKTATPATAAPEESNAITKTLRKGERQPANKP